MKLEKIKEILNKKDLDPDLIDIRNNITKKMKKKWAIQKIIEDEKFCLNCKAQSLVDCDLKGNLIMCTKCGKVSSVKEYIEK